MKKFRIIWVVGTGVILFSFLWVGYAAKSSNLPLPPVAALESIEPADLLEHLEFLASDELGGRYALDASNRIAARYLASRLRHSGFHGGAEDGSFFQRFQLTSGKINTGKTFIETEKDGQRVRFKVREAFQLVSGSAGSDKETELVLTPAAWLLADHQPRADLAGSIAVIPFSQGSTTQGSPFSIFRRVMPKLPDRRFAGVILLVQGRTSARQLPPQMRRSSGGGRPQLAGAARSASVPPILWAFDPLIDWIFEGSGMDAETVFGLSAANGPRPLGKKLRLSIAGDSSQQSTQNVIGILDGRDPQLKNEYVMCSAHFDHLPARGKEVYNGADDDGSGTAALLEIAQAFWLAPARRSVIIMFHTAEELGLLGSQYFVQHPTVPLEAIVVDLNVDMIGRSRAPEDNKPADRELSDANTVYLIGSDKLSQELHQLSEQTNQETAKMNLDYRYNSEGHPLRLYYRSDHWNYAKNGIPVIFYFTGIHEDYHRATDDVEKLDFEKMARITKLIFATGWRLANLDQRLKLDGAK